jgi:hypothetical protein
VEEESRHEAGRLPPGGDRPPSYVWMPQLSSAALRYFASFARLNDSVATSPPSDQS